MKKIKFKVQNPYQIKYRYRDRVGNFGTEVSIEGQFLDWETVQRQVQNIIRSKKHRDIEIKIIKDGKLYDPFGNQINEPIKITK
jgi:hypothetical protein